MLLLSLKMINLHFIEKENIVIKSKTTHLAAGKIVVQTTNNENRVAEANDTAPEAIEYAYLSNSNIITMVG